MTSTEPRNLQKISMIASGQSPTGLQSPTSTEVTIDPALSKFKASPQGAKLRDWVKTEYRKCKSDKLKTQRQWDVHWEYYAGNQWVSYIQGAGLQTRRSAKARSTVNLLRPILRTEFSRMTANKPSASATPASGSDEDIFAAWAAEQVWESLYDRKKLHQVLTEAMVWNGITGNAFIKCVWDKNLIDPTFKDATGQEIPGDIRYGVVTPYHLFVPDLLLVDLQDQPYVFEAYTKPVVWVKHYFQGLLEKPVTPNICSRSEIFENRYFNGEQGKEATPDAVLIIECYIKPGGCDMLPYGGMVTLVGDEIVQISQEFPFSHGNYPYAHFGHIPTGKFYRDSIMVDLIPLQQEYNGTRSHIAESKRRMAKLQLLSPKGCMDVQKYVNSPLGAVVEYLPGLGEPKPLKVQELPSYVLNELPLIQNDMQTISGQHEVSKGQAPGSGVTAATAISFLQEKDETMMRVTYDNIEAGMTDLARLSLQNVMDYWDIPRIVRTVGPDGAFDSKELKGSQLSYDIKIEPGSSLPTSKAARQSFLMDLFTNGAISAEQLLDLVDIGGQQKLTEQIRVDQRQAQRENVRMKDLTPEDLMLHELKMQMQAEQGGGDNVGPDGLPVWNGDPHTWPAIVEVHDWDNHAIHIVVHNNFRKGQEFEMLPDTTKEQFQKHIQMHQMAQVMQAQQQAMQMGGMPPPGGAPGGDMGGPPGMQPGAPPTSPGQNPMEAQASQALDQQNIGGMAGNGG